MAPFSWETLDTRCMALVRSRGLEANCGKKTAMIPSAQMMGKMILAAPIRRRRPNQTPYRVGLGSMSRPKPYRAT